MLFSVSLASLCAFCVFCCSGFGSFSLFRNHFLNTLLLLNQNDHYLFKRQYEVPETSIAYVDREIIAIDEVAGDFASTVVTSILEGF